MNVLMTADAIGGVWTYALDLATWLGARGVGVTLATMGAPPTAEQVSAARRAQVELVTSTFRLEWMDAPWDDVARAGEWLLDLESKLRPDVVHVNGYAHGALPWRAPQVVVAHSCVPGDVHLLATPMFHCTALYSLLPASAYLGSCVVVAPRPDIAELVDLIERHRVTTFLGVPTLFHFLAAMPGVESRDLSSLRLIAYAGSPCPAGR